ncbi:Integrase zinc binding domain [Popillia japonica]|uniref:Integrase zinc binding domain n=1 Tax=Popillia japonica TaxID=7064 RepID=A0AAW1L437_POPJA
MQVEVIRSAHERGHFACRKTRELIEQEYFIPGLQSKVERFITNCVPCIMVNRKAGKKEGYLQALAERRGSSSSRSTLYRVYRVK